MPQSHAQLLAHLIFSTKNRHPFLDETILPRVHGYIATILRDLGSHFVVVGGVSDHIHILFDQPKLRAPASTVEAIKKESSKFVKTLGAPYRGFFWQRGYGLFSVSPTHRENVERYIRSQAQHHRTVSFQDEYRTFLRRYRVDADERYLWD